MDTVTISKDVFTKILGDVEMLIDDVEMALDTTVEHRLCELDTGKVKAKSERELDEYLRKRGVKIE